MDLENLEYARDVTINPAHVVQEDIEEVLVVLDITHPLLN
jgi:hypothetical protein